MPLDVDKEKKWVSASLKSLGKPGGDTRLQAYIGSPYPCFGLTTPQMRGIHKEFQSRHPALTAAEVNALAKALWSGNSYEEKSFAIGILGRNEAVLDQQSWKLMDGMVDKAVGWALSDGLASGPVSAMVHASPARFKEILRWSKSENFWRRRASTYALYGFVMAGELAKPFELLERLVYDPEFWVQRAVGTWLRECWKKDSNRTEAFLRAHVTGLPPVTITVATERAPKSFRDELRKANKGNRRST